MENIKKEFKFGYGKVLVAAYGTVLELTELDHSFEIGAEVDEELEKYASASMVKTNILMSYNDTLRLLNELIDLRDNPNSTCKKIFVKNCYILDFTEYNKESVSVVIRAIDRIISHNSMIFAC